MRSERLKAIVLRRTNYAEADRIIQLITTSGRRSVIAKGVRREKSKMAGGIELFAVCEVVIKKGHGDLGILASARIVNFYNNILKDYNRTQFAYDAIKMIIRACEHSDDSDWYDLLDGVLSSLDEPLIALGLIKVWFYVRFCKLIGHELSFYYDVAGDKLKSGSLYCYDSVEKGFIRNDGGSIHSNHLKLFRLMSEKPIKTLAQIGGVDAVIDDCMSVIVKHLNI